MAAHIFAAIDVGSFEMELGIYELSAKAGIRQIDHLRHVIALGKDTYKDGKISYELIDDACETLRKFSDVMKEYGVTDYRAYATSAMREAKNKQIVLDQFFVRAGIRVEIISNSEQRFISMKAVATRDTDFNRIVQKGTAIADVGFGSIQMSVYDENTLISTQNLSLGMLGIREMIAELQADAITSRQLIEELVDNELTTFRKLYLKDHSIKTLVGLGEGLLFLSRGRDNSRTVSEWISAKEFQGIYEKLQGMSADQIEDRFDVSADYATLLMPCAIIYRRLFEMTGADSLWMPGFRICDGMAAEYGIDTKKIRMNHNFEEDILAASRNIAKRYRCHGDHIQFIEKTVLNIFDTTQKFHGLNKRERLLLQIATILHDCGKFISIKSPSESAYNIIMSTEIIGLSHKEREIVANVVFFNIQRFDYSRNSFDSADIEPESIIKIAKMIAMLRLANALDRSHAQKLRDCKMSLRDNILTITTQYDGSINLERLAFEKKAKFFEEIFGIHPLLKQKKMK